MVEGDEDNHTVEETKEIIADKTETTKEIIVDKTEKIPVQTIIEVIMVVVIKMKVLLMVSQF